VFRVGRREAAVDREHHKAYLEQLDTARGLLLAAHDELDRNNLANVYQGKRKASISEESVTSATQQKKHDSRAAKTPNALRNLHPEIYEKCHDLYEKGAYPEAVEKSFKVVRDRLRKLTGHETGSEAFGKGKLHIEGAAAANVDHDFNEAVKFLTMAIDRFRNEKSHTSDAKIDDPIRAYEYLRLSSLAMNLLEDSRILP
jgi:uncharacterized protein (TIGR02391 family)